MIAAQMTGGKCLAWFLFPFLHGCDEHPSVLQLFVVFSSPG